VRGSKVEGKHECGRCNKAVHNLHRYAKSSIGPVILCASCKTPLIRKAKAKLNKITKTDALGYASTGGRFEGNRSKH
jgi:hypothetical protein